MARRHLTIKEPGWRRGMWVNGLGAIATGVVGVVIAVTKFTHGAWIIMLIVPMTVAVLVRVNHSYERRAARARGRPPAGDTRASSHPRDRSPSCWSRS